MTSPTDTLLTDLATAREGIRCIPGCAGKCRCVYDTIKADEIRRAKEEGRKGESRARPRAGRWGDALLPAL